MISIDYENDRQCALITTDDENHLWGELKLLLSNYEIQDFEVGHKYLRTPWWSLKARWSDVLEWADYFDVEFILSKKAESFFNTEKNNSLTHRKFTEDDISKTLEEVGFIRKLRPFQLRNVLKLVNVQNGAATFSVPGAGKTTEALACYFLRKSRESRLLVVCPKNAFGVWEDEISECAPGAKIKVIRLTGNADEVSKKLNGEGDVFLITYQKLSLETYQIASNLASSDLMFLDESHYIKKGGGGIWAESALRISHLVGYKLILSGTPLPNSTKDLESQFQFIGVHVDSNDRNISSLIDPFYVRTTKSELGLRPYRPSIIDIPMGEAQRELYLYAKSEDFRQLSSLRARDKNSLRMLGKSAQRLLQITSNPFLLARFEFENFEPIKNAINEGPGPKFQYVCQRARSLVEDGKKCLIWSHFVMNVEAIAAQLSDLGAEFIHGGVDAGTNDDANSRESIIRRFHEDSGTMVLVANPAACAEAISLHRVCHHAIYLDRNFNAAQFLQSIDRIHRLGLDDSVETNVEILRSPETIDDIVNQRLNSKVSNMQRVLDDYSIQPEIEEIDLDDDDVFNSEDAESYFEYLAE